MRCLFTYTILFFLFIAGCAPKSSDHSSGNKGLPDDRGKGQAKISLYKAGSQSQAISADSVFSINDDDYLHAQVILKEDQKNDISPGMYHLVWVGPDGEAFFTKRIDVIDTVAPYIPESSISLPSDKRQPGKYCLKVYDFREPLAEKYFRLIPAGEINPELAAKFLPEIVLDDHSENHSDNKDFENPVFTLREHGWLRAGIRLNLPAGLKNGICDFVISWSGPDGEPFFTKEFAVKTGKSRVVLQSSISIPPGKRDPGKYNISLLLQDELLAKKQFSLVSGD